MNQHDQAEIVLEETDCPVCRSSNHRRLLTTTDPLYEIGDEFQIVKCRDCRHIFMNPIPSSESLAACYPADYGPHANRTLAPQSSTALNSTDHSEQKTTPWYLSTGIRKIPGLRRLYHWLSNTCSTWLPAAPHGNARAVELGCATGNFLSELSQAGWNVEGIELVESAAELARQKGYPVHVGTLESAELSADTYEAAFAWMVIEHLPDPASALCEFHRILKHDALLAFSVPNVSCWERFAFGRNWYVWEVPRHLQYFGPGTLRRLLTESGFEDIRFIHQRNILNVIGSIGIALRRLRPGSRLADRLIDFPNSPGMWWQLLLAPVAIVLALLRQSGRLTIVARCRKQMKHSHSQPDSANSESA